MPVKKIIAALLMLAAGFGAILSVLALLYYGQFLAAHGPDPALIEPAVQAAAGFLVSLVFFVIGRRMWAGKRKSDKRQGGRFAAFLSEAGLMMSFGAIAGLAAAFLILEEERDLYMTILFFILAGGACLVFLGRVLSARRNTRLSPEDFEEYERVRGK